MIYIYELLKRSWAQLADNLQSCVLSVNFVYHGQYV